VSGDKAVVTPGYRHVPVWTAFLCVFSYRYLTSRMVLLTIIAGRCIVMSPEGHMMCVCVCGALQDMGTVVLGKVESGGVMKGSSLLLMPNRVSV